MQFNKYVILKLGLLYLICTPLIADDSLGLLWYDQLDNRQMEKLSAAPVYDIVLRQAFQQEIEGQLDKALELYQEFFEKGGEGAFARLAHARSLIKKGQLKEALLQIDRSIALAPRDSKYVVFKLSVLRKAKQDQQALLLAENKKDRFDGIVAGIEFHLAELYYKKNEKEKSKLHFTLCLQSLENAGSEGTEYRSIALWRLTQIYLEQNELTKARPYLESYLRMHPGSYFSKFIYVEYLLLPEGEYQQAYRLLQDIAQLNREQLLQQRIKPDLLLDYLVISSFATRDIQFSRYIYEVRKLRKWNLLQYSMLLQERGQNRESMQNILKILKKKPDSQLARMVMLRILQGNHSRYDLYIDALLDSVYYALQKSRNNLARQYLGDLRSMQQRKLMSDRQSVRYMRFEAQLAAQLSQFNRAALWLQEALASKSSKEIDQKNQELLRLDRAAYLSRSDRSLSIEQAFQLLEKTFTNPAMEQHAQNMRYRMHLRKQEWPQIIALYEQHSQSGSDRQSAQSQTRMILAVALWQQGQIKQAEQILTDLMQKSSPLQDMARNFWAYQMAKEKKQLQQARQYSSNTLQNEPLNFNYHDTLGYIHYLEGQNHKALYHLGAARILMDLNQQAEAEVLYHLAKATRTSGKKRLALAYCKRALSLHQKRKQHDQIEPWDLEDQELERKLEKTIQDLQSELN